MKIPKQLTAYIQKMVLLLPLVFGLGGTAYAQWQASGVGGGYVYYFAKDGSNVYAGGYGDLGEPVIARTTNNGDSWTSLRGDLPMYGEVRTIAFAQNSIMIGGIYKTTNGGVNWKWLTNLPSLPQNPVLFNTANRDTLYVGVFGNGTLYRTTNEGQTWDSTGRLLSGPYGANSLWNLALLKDGVFYCAKDSGLYRSTNEGATWTRTRSIAQGTTICNIVSGGSSVYACGFTQQGGTVIYRSTNSGLSWSLATQSVYAPSCFAADGNLLFGGGSLIVSANGGATWQSISNGLPSLQGFPLSIAAKDSIVFASFGMGQGVYKRSIAGINVSTPQPTARTASAFSLSQNYPNPFNPSTVISYQLAVTSPVTLKVYDVLGREVATLVNEKKTAGVYEAEFNGSGLASGIYFYRLVTGTFASTKKMILLK